MFIGSYFVEEVARIILSHRPGLQVQPCGRASTLNLEIFGQKWSKVVRSKKKFRFIFCRVTRVILSHRSGLQVYPCGRASTLNLEIFGPKWPKMAFLGIFSQSQRFFDPRWTPYRFFALKKRFRIVSRPSEHVQSPVWPFSCLSKRRNL